MGEHMRVKIESLNKEEKEAWEILHKRIECRCGREMERIDSLQGNYLTCKGCGNVKM